MPMPAVPAPASPLVEPQSASLIANVSAASSWPTSESSFEGRPSTALFLWISAVPRYYLGRPARLIRPGHKVAESGKVAFMSTQLALAELEAGLAHIRQSPKTERARWYSSCAAPETNVRSVVRGRAFADRGVGSGGRLAHTRQLFAPATAPPTPTCSSISSTPALALIAQDEERWQLAGDQLIIDLDLSKENLPPGTRLALGAAIIEVTAQPHTGCNKFSARFGVDAAKWVNSPAGKELQLRGINAKVVQPSTSRGRCCDRASVNAWQIHTRALCRAQAECQQQSAWWLAVHETTHFLLLLILLLPRHCGYGNWIPSHRASTLTSRSEGWKRGAF